MMTESIYIFELLILLKEGKAMHDNPDAYPREMTDVSS